MGAVHQGHFGGNIVLTNDSAEAGSPFREMLDEINFTNLRYPGGGVTENQTWENGGLSKMFGAPMEPGSDGYVMTLREALQMCEDNGSSISIVVPTFQFYNAADQSFDSAGFQRYVGELEKAILEFPDVTISGFEIGNEYWAEITAADYGIIANHQIPVLDGLSDRLASRLGEDWDQPDIGLQAGAAWRASGEQESEQIAEQISLGNRELVDTIHQHAYPNPYKDFELQKDGVIKPASVFETLEGFRSDLKISLSEFNIGIYEGGAEVYGVNQGALWIEEFGRHVDSGVDSMDHWGLAYKWLTTKFYDTKFPPGESNSGEIAAIATPMGQVYDLASSHLIGKSTMSDTAAIEGIRIEGQVGITGFEEAGERIVFLSNMSGKDATVDLSTFSGKAVFAHHIVPADSPESSWHDESSTSLPSADKIVDARGDMKVVSGSDLNDEFTLGDNQMLVVIVGDQDRDYTIEGSHNVTDPVTGQVDDLIIGGNGQDILRGHVGDDTLDGGGGNDVLLGGRGDDDLSGGDGHDVLFSGDGADTLSGGKGNDVLAIGGEPSDDRVTSATGEGADLVVMDGGRDVIIEDFSADDILGFGGLFADRDAFEGSLHTEGEDLSITLPTGKIVSLIGGAQYASGLGDQIFDFTPSSEAADQVDRIFQELTADQYGEIGSSLAEIAWADGHDDTVWRDRTEQYDDLGPDGPNIPSVPDDPTDLPEPEPGNDEDPAEPGDGPSEEMPDVEYPDIPVTDEEPVLPPPDDTVEDDEASHAGGSCFVATAAYGDPWHPDVVALRAFRDTHLVRYKMGRRFIRFYWQVGPKLARVITPTSYRGRLARYLLSEIVRGGRLAANLYCKATGY
ncbi:CFI-box-CTERM domain-containing protein [Paracoccus sp. (in: a-proteobacteria)]|uniref:CFI-box-CTERM domain-containing protein n=1 Tax=Paracoccus sp. TaxID=267 RepID=UPI0035AE1985